MANFSSFFPAASTGGGAIPQTEIFTSSGIWLVPQDVQDKITSDGHADIGILIVGGGSGSYNHCGEVRNEIIKLTSATYSPSSLWASATQPEIAVTVGAAAGDSGIGYDTNVADVLLEMNYNTSSSVTLIPGTYSQDSSNQLLIKTIDVLWVGPGTGPTGYSWTGTTQPTYTTTSGHGVPGIAGTYTKSIATWNGTDSYFDGTLQFTGNRYGATKTISFSWNGATRTISRSANMSGYDWQGDIVYKSAAGVPTIKAENGGSGTPANFRNLSTSTEGYLGFSRYGSTRPGSVDGSNAQGGYVQIFF